MHRYSGADIGVIVRDAIMIPIRKVQMATHFKQVTLERGGQIISNAWMPCSPGEPGAVEKIWSQVWASWILCLSARSWCLLFSFLN